MQSFIKNVKEAFHPVRIVGAGPGDPELITVKGRNILENADTILYAGSQIPDTMLGWTEDGRKVYNSEAMALDEILAVIEDDYHDGRRVVHLYPGDPHLHTGLPAQLAQMEKRGIGYEVIPGVTTARESMDTTGDIVVAETIAAELKE